MMLQSQLQIYDVHETAWQAFDVGEQSQTLGIQCHQGETLLSHLGLVMHSVEDWVAL